MYRCVYTYIYIYMYILLGPWGYHYFRISPFTDLIQWRSCGMCFDWRNAWHFHCSSSAWCLGSIKKHGFWVGFLWDSCQMRHLYLIASCFWCISMVPVDDATFILYTLLVKDKSFVSSWVNCSHVPCKVLKVVRDISRELQWNFKARWVAMRKDESWIRMLLENNLGRMAPSFLRQ